MITVMNCISLCQMGTKRLKKPREGAAEEGFILKDQTLTCDTLHRNPYKTYTQLRQLKCMAKFIYPFKRYNQSCPSPLVPRVIALLVVFRSAIPRIVNLPDSLLMEVPNIDDTQRSQGRPPTKQCRRAGTHRKGRAEWPGFQLIRVCRCFRRRQTQESGEFDRALWCTGVD